MVRRTISSSRPLAALTAAAAILPAFSAAGSLPMRGFQSFGVAKRAPVFCAPWLRIVWRLRSGTSLIFHSICRGSMTVSLLLIIPPPPPPPNPAERTFHPPGFAPVVKAASTSAICFLSGAAIKASRASPSTRMARVSMASKTGARSRERVTGVAGSALVTMRTPPWRSMDLTTFERGAFSAWIVTRPQPEIHLQITTVAQMASTPANNRSFGFRMSLF